MKILVSVMALAVTLAWPSAGEAQTKKSKARSTQATQQPQTRKAKVVARAAVRTPCAARTWAGCQGWDPDPNVRMMIQMDAGKDDY